MHFYILTLFPDMIRQIMQTSIIGRAVNSRILTFDAVNIRDYTADKHKKVDDYPYGGGAGMVMQAQPVYDAWLTVMQKIRQAGGTCARTVYLTPQAPVFTQKMAKAFAKEQHLILLCGHYEGIDERVLEEIVTDYVSIGDYVLTGGELPAMVLADAVARMVPGVLTNEQSGSTESLEGNLLEYPQYSRPEEWNGKKVPPVLLSGNHANVDAWRREQSVRRTAERRPDLLLQAALTEKERELYL
ncbi:tRNA (guanine-N(1)-)-methyltransferase [Eubacterium plexicaudatum ASF492]|uniref:tRNA (guanine-N(1)-)-methyltransferase n=1 Tax=Eubacterium plexicaudatum ASF492 TaxID=1235802 RepID=N2A8D9_9FIRM|nr:tRNA (guanine-N(1)-)-methyltransferase [Eubacterium plexicaudatum ASF492]